MCNVGINSLKNSLLACVSYVGNLSYIFNADVNGALNILRKSNVVDLEVLYSRGEVDTPVRIRIA